MTLDNLQENDIITARVYKRYGIRSWANNYEIRSLTTPLNSYALLNSLAHILAQWEGTFHLSGVAIPRVVISTYQRDSRPYNPQTFLSVNVGEWGTRNPSGNTQVLPLQACLFVRRLSVFGRPGKLFYRGVLSEGDLVASGFDPWIDSTYRNQFQTLLSAIFSNPNFSGNWQFVMASGLLPSIVRNVVGFVVSEQAVFKKLDNAYFDRRSGGGD